MRSIFITGTDTGIGKTVVCGLLAGYLRDQGIDVVTQKWIQTGTQDGDSDIAAHAAWAGGEDLGWANLADLRVPCAYPLPASPHLAAAQTQEPVNIERIHKAYQALAARFESVLVEGIGGVLVPIDHNRLVVDIVRELTLPVLIVSANRLGTINHTLLTVEALRARDLDILGLVFHEVPAQEPLVAADNPKVIAAHTGLPILGQLPWSTEITVQQEAFRPIGAALLEQLVKEQP